MVVPRKPLWARVSPGLANQASFVQMYIVRALAMASARYTRSKTLRAVTR
jgi:hypothetical protein